MSDKTMTPDQREKLKEAAQLYGYKVANPVTRDMVSMSRGQLAQYLEYAHLTGAESMVPEIERLTRELDEARKERFCDAVKTAAEEELKAGMILERVKPENTVTDELVVTAVGRDSFLALDSESKEHRFYATHADEYYSIGYVPNEMEKETE